MNSYNLQESLITAPTHDPLDRLLVHCCYHKVGTVWFARVLSDIAKEFGWNYHSGRQHGLQANTHIFLQNHSYIQRENLRPYLGSHMIRDPRDVVISGYFYHLWSKEKWNVRPRWEWQNRRVWGKSYQKLLNSVPQDEGILLEIERIRPMIKNMESWDYQDPNFIEVRYEELFLDNEAGFRKIFEFYGFSSEQIEQSLEIVERHSFKNRKKKKASDAKSRHLRKGTPGDWKNFFKPIHIDYFKQLYPNILKNLSYESSDNW